MGKVEEAEELMKEIMGKIAILTDEVQFKKIYGFTLKEYIQKRKEFGDATEETANHVQKVVHDTGIAKTTAGGVAIAAGASVIGGILLAPFTAGASLALTVGGIAGGVAGAATSLTAAIVKDRHIQSDDNKMKEALKEFDDQEKVTTEIFNSLNVDMEKLRELLEDPTVMEMIKGYGRQSAVLGYSIMYGSYTVVSTVRAIRFARSVAAFIQADFYAVAGIAEGFAAPGIGGARIFGRALVLAGSTTAKVLSGAFAVLGVAFGTWDLITGINDINGSEVADTYREFAKEYKENTAKLEEGLQELNEMISEENFGEMSNNSGKTTSEEKQI